MSEETCPPKARGLTRLINAFGYSCKGVAFAWRTQEAFRQDVMLFVAATGLAFYLEVTAVERVLLIGSVALVLIVELLNSAVEACIDRISKEFHFLSGAAKDMGSAAVLVSLLLAALTWATILWDKV